MARKQVINISVIMILVMAFLHKSKLQKIHRMSCRNEATFKANGRDFVVKESSSKLISTIKALLLANCARSCIKTSECKSFLFKKNATLSTEKNCQLLNVEKNNLTSYDMQNMTGWVYYEPLQQGTSRCQPSTCSPGYKCIEDCNSANGFTCPEIDECQSNPCKNGATCNNLVNAYSCTCVPGYAGTNCEADINECLSSPCQNGGTCIDQINAYSCQCTSRFSGSNCETAVCESGWIFNGGYCYAFKTISTSWQSARDNCVSDGADLIVIKDSTEASFVYANKASGIGYWLGLTDLSVEGTFIWVDGTSLSYQNWHADEPNNFDGLEDCGQIRWEDNAWNDDKCSQEHRFICEKVH